MWKTILGQTIYQLIVTLVMYFAGKGFIKYDRHPNSPNEFRQFNTLIFNTFVWMQIFDAINCRRIDNSKNIFEGFWRNRFFMLIMCIMIGGQVIIVQFSGAAFVVEPIWASHWGISIVAGFVTLPIGFLIRCIPDPWVRIDKPIKKLIPKALTRWLADRKAKKEAKARNADGSKDDEDFSKEWTRVHKQVNDDLALYMRLRGGRRLNAIKQSIRNPKDMFHRSRSGSRQSVLPALIAPGAMAGSVGGGVTPSDRRSINSRAVSSQEDGNSVRQSPSRRDTPSTGDNLV
jgi:Ca2+-transporting ATPase